MIGAAPLSALPLIAQPRANAAGRQEKISERRDGQGTIGGSDQRGRVGDSATQSAVAANRAQAAVAPHF